MGKLTKTKIDHLLNKSQEKQVELTDGNNLYLIVTKAGKCKFKYRVRNANKASWVVIGHYPEVSLLNARAKALELRGLIDKGVNPNQIKQQDKSKQISVTDLVNLYFAERLPQVRLKLRSRNHFIASVNKDIVQIIGNMLVKDVTDEVIKTQLLLPKIANGSPSVARMIRNSCKVIFDFAIELGIIKSNPIGTIKASLLYRDKPRSRHLSSEEIATMFKLIYQAPIKTQHKIAFHLSLMLLTRKTELIHTTWDCIRLVNDVTAHEIPTFIIKDSKMGSQLVIPLPKQAVKLFEILKQLSQGSQYLFIGRSGIQEPVSTTTLNCTMKPINKAMFGDSKIDYCTIHDLRRTGATQLSEMGYPSDWIEVALNHSKTGIKGVYQRSQYIKQRAEMLQVWADKLDELIGAELLPYDKTFIV